MTGDTKGKTSLFQTAKFKGQSAKQVMAINAYDDLVEDAANILRTYKALNKFYWAFRVLQLVGGFCVGLSLALLWKLDPLTCFLMAAVSLAFRYYADLRMAEIRTELQDMEQAYLLKLQAAANMRIWLEAVVQNN